MGSERHKAWWPPSGLRAWCAPGSSRQRLPQILLGLVWLADGALQCQPSMFGRGFVTGLLLPMAAGNPAPVAGSITAMGRFLEPHIALWNALFAVTQLAIGLGLLVRRTVRPALVASFVWSLLVWWFAEGLGGLLAGGASPLTGAPGAVLLYVLVGLLVWPRHEGAVAAGQGGAPHRGLLGDRVARVTWAVLWVGGAALLLQPASLAGGALRQALVTAASGQPRWYASVLTGAAGALGTHGTLLTVAVAAEMVVVGLGGALGRLRPGLLGAATVLAVAIWVFPEGLGGILTGQGTDPNTGPLLVLAGLAWYRAQPLARPRGVLVAPAAPAAA